MADQTYLNNEEHTAIFTALQEGEADRAFTLLADYLARNEMALTDATLKIYLERELFACLRGRGHIFGTI